MRFPLAAAMLMLGASLASAQMPPQPPAQPAQPDPVDVILERWEKAMSQIDSFEAECHRTSKDKVFNNVEKFEGRVRFMKGSAATKTAPRASLELVRKDRPDVYEKLVCNGTHVFEYVASDKAIRVYELPKNVGVGDDNFLQFVFGMKAAEAKSRYKMVYAGRDDHYYYLDVFPIQPRDQAEFTKARLVFLQQTSLPRQIWFLKPNQNEISWDFPRANPNAQLTAQTFPNPTLPQGWQWQRMPAPGQNPPANPNANNVKPTVRFNNGN
jgi:TIGR03009 family protein